MRTLVKKSFEKALRKYDVLISPAAPSAAYKIGMLLSAHVTSSSPKRVWPFPCFHLTLITRAPLAGEKTNDPLAMYAGDIMTV